MKYAILFFMIVYLVLFFYPRFRVSINGQLSNNVLYRIIGAAIVSAIATLCIALPIYGVVRIFI